MDGQPCKARAYEAHFACLITQMQNAAGLRESKADSPLIIFLSPLRKAAASQTISLPQLRIFSPGLESLIGWGYIEISQTARLVKAETSAKGSFG